VAVAVACGVSLCEALIGTRAAGSGWLRTALLTGQGTILCLPPSAPTRTPKMVCAKCEKSKPPSPFHSQLPNPVAHPPPPPPPPPPRPILARPSPPRQSWPSHRRWPRPTSGGRPTRRPAETATRARWARTSCSRPSRATRPTRLRPPPRPRQSTLRGRPHWRARRAAAAAAVRAARSESARRASRRSSGPGRNTVKVSPRAGGEE